MWGFLARAAKFAFSWKPVAIWGADKVFNKGKATEYVTDKITSVVGEENIGVLKEKAGEVFDEGMDNAGEFLSETKDVVVEKGTELVTGATDAVAETASDALEESLGINDEQTKGFLSKIGDFFKRAFGPVGGVLFGIGAAFGGFTGKGLLGKAKNAMKFGAIAAVIGAVLNFVVPGLGDKLANAFGMGGKDKALDANRGNETGIERNEEPQGRSREKEAEPRADKTPDAEKKVVFEEVVVPDETDVTLEEVSDAKIAFNDGAGTAPTPSVPGVQIDQPFDITLTDGFNDKVGSVIFTAFKPGTAAQHFGVSNTVAVPLNSPLTIGQEEQPVHTLEEEYVPAEV